MSILFKTAPVGELLDADEKAGIVKGYGSYFGNKDSDNDVIVKGAYKKTIEENGERVKYLYQHDMFKPIGKMIELHEDDKGLVFVAEVAKTQLGMDTIELMKALCHHGKFSWNHANTKTTKRGYSRNIVRLNYTKLALLQLPPMTRRKSLM